MRIIIPCKPYVRKYLVKRYGTVHVVSTTSFLGSLIQMLLVKKKLNGSLALKSDDANAGYTIELPEKWYTRNGHRLTKSVKNALANAFEIMLREEMCVYTDQMVRNGRKAMPVIKEFLALYEITENDVLLESMYKVYQRYCDKKEQAFVGSVKMINKLK